mmetsp:Transcript_47366/g.138044  ORF Transcript_47366/g.138044 Transcript_47366/m.138044 type:complete len:254 (-) Transcript_47366:167-928(-)
MPHSSNVARSPPMPPTSSLGSDAVNAGWRTMSPNRSPPRRKVHRNDRARLRPHLWNQPHRHPIGSPMSIDSRPTAATLVRQHGERRQYAARSVEDQRRHRKNPGCGRRPQERRARLASRPGGHGSGSSGGPPRRLRRRPHAAPSRKPPKGFRRSASTDASSAHRRNRSPRPTRPSATTRLQLRLPLLEPKPRKSPFPLASHRARPPHLWRPGGQRPPPGPSRSRSRVRWLRGLPPSPCGIVHHRLPPASARKP